MMKRNLKRELFINKKFQPSSSQDRSIDEFLGVTKVTLPNLVSAFHKIKKKYQNKIFFKSLFPLCNHNDDAFKLRYHWKAIDHGSDIVFIVELRREKKCPSLQAEVYAIESWEKWLNELYGIIFEGGNYIWSTREDHNQLPIMELKEDVFSELKQKKAAHSKWPSLRYQQLVEVKHEYLGSHYVALNQDTKKKINGVDYVNSERAKYFSRDMVGKNFNTAFNTLEKTYKNNYEWYQLGLVLALEQKYHLESFESERLLRILFMEIVRIETHLKTLHNWYKDLKCIRSFYTISKLLTSIEDFKRDIKKLFTKFFLLKNDSIKTQDTLLKDQVIFKKLNNYYENHLAMWEKSLRKLKKLDFGQIEKREGKEWALTGPNLRASGLGFDSRKQSGSLSYAGLDFDIKVGREGKVYDRMQVRVLEIGESFKIIKQIFNMFPGGHVDHYKNEHPFRFSLEENISMGHGAIFKKKYSFHFEKRGDEGSKDKELVSLETPEGEFFLIACMEFDEPQLKSALKESHISDQIILKSFFLQSPSFINGQIIPSLLLGHSVKNMIGSIMSLNIDAWDFGY